PVQVQFSLLPELGEAIFQWASEHSPKLADVSVTLIVEAACLWTQLTATSDTGAFPLTEDTFVAAALDAHRFVSGRPPAHLDTSSGNPAGTWVRQGSLE